MAIMNVADIEKDITGQWWSGDYLLTIKDGNVYFDTNIGTEHTPFYDYRMLTEPIILESAGGSNLKLCKSFSIVEYKSGKTVMLIAFYDADKRMILHRLTRYIGDKQIL